MNPTRSDFYDPFLLNNMKNAVDRIIKAIENKERIIIYGDYDTYIDCSSMDINDLGHQKEYKEKWRNER